jgi:hypothetical protein
MEKSIVVKYIKENKIIDVSVFLKEDISRKDRKEINAIMRPENTVYTSGKDGVNLTGLDFKNLDEASDETVIRMIEKITEKDGSEIKVSRTCIDNFTEKSYSLLKNKIDEILLSEELPKV